MKQILFIMLAVTCLSSTQLRAEELQSLCGPDVECQQYDWIITSEYAEPGWEMQYKTALEVKKYVETGMPNDVEFLQELEDTMYWLHKECGDERGDDKLACILFHLDPESN